MENRITELEENQQQIIAAIADINANLTSIGMSTTESIKAIMEGFQSVNVAMHDMIKNFTHLENRIADLEKKIGSLPLNSN